MLSTKLHAAINEQINAELWSAYLYLSMSMDAEAKGLKVVLCTVVRGAGSRPYLDELPQLTRCKGRAQAYQGGRYRVELDFGYVFADT